MAECFSQLESNNPVLVDELRARLNDQFKIVTEPWLLNGFYDYYLQTNSSRAIDILVNIREPHHTFLFDRISESINIRNSKSDSKVQALTLLGHVVRRHPTWLYHITDHSVFKNLIKLLKNETDILPLLSALLALIVLLPIIPYPMGHHLPDVFQIFSRLAAWNCSNPCKIVEEQMVHMQIALYALFQRLYGMYPCNFLAYLRNEYRNKDLSPIFTHTIKPMLATVKMHPSLVTTSKDNETTTEKWKKMGAHDVIVECEKFSLDLTDRCANESCFFTSSIRSRSGTTNSALHAETNSLQILKSTATFFGSEKEFFSPSLILCPTPPITETTPSNIQHVQGSGQRLLSGISSQEGTSPPEAAIEATPETTPIRDTRYTRQLQLGPTKVAKALNNFTSKGGPSGGTTPTHSQPPSPMRKDSSPFTFQPEPLYFPPKNSHAHHMLERVLQERQQFELQQRQAPPSPLKLIGSNEASFPTRIESPVSQEDEEVVAIVRQGEICQHANLRQCDSVLHDVEETGTEVDLMDDCGTLHGSPCAQGGLHMPNSQSMHEFKKLINRMRYHSQCGPDLDRNETSSASSGLSSLKVRRANSCPEMKKIPCAPVKESNTKPLDPTNEEGNENQPETILNGNLTTHANMSINLNVHMSVSAQKFNKFSTSVSAETQTENFWPMPYEHLFLGIFPSMETADVRPSPAPSPAPYNVLQEKLNSASIYDTLDKYIDVAVHSTEKETVKSLKDQLQLMQLQLLFERHRRETHALKNRRLLADARDMKALQEHNSALRDQVQLHQKEIDNLREQLENLKRESFEKEKIIENEVLYHWQNQCKLAQKECKEMKVKNADMEKNLKEMNEKYHELNKLWQNAESMLVDATAEVKIAKEQAWAGERGREELEIVNRELLLCGEIQLKYQERLADVSNLKQTDQELIQLTDTYKNEIKALNQQLEAKANTLEAYRTRTGELEHMVTQGEEMLTGHKKLLNDIKDECHEKLEAVESKYQAQLSINRGLEERMLEQWQRIELLSSKLKVQSPDTSSCHEVNASNTDRTNTAAGLSPHSSPLSASLASSEGSIAFINPEAKELKNLQTIADQKDPPQKVVAREESDPVLIKQSISSNPTASTATTSKHD